MTKGRNPFSWYVKLYKISILNKQKDGSGAKQDLKNSFLMNNIARKRNFVIQISFLMH